LVLAIIRVIDRNCHVRAPRLGLRAAGRMVADEIVLRLPLMPTPGRCPFVVDCEDLGRLEARFPSERAQRNTTHFADAPGRPARHNASGDHRFQGSPREVEVSIRTHEARAHVAARPPRRAGESTKGSNRQPDDIDFLSPEKVRTAFTSLPRVLKLVWDIQPAFTVMLGVLYIAQGFLPTATAYISKLLIDGVVVALHEGGRSGTMAVVVWLVVAQFGVQGLSSLLQTLSNIVQQLLQERTSTTVQLMLMEKANTLDLAFFEDARFYDSLQEAQREAVSRPISMISQTFGVGRTVVTLLSMLIVLTHLAWWLAPLALAAPIPAFVANVRYGWRGYRQMRWQSPLRREMGYYGTLLTTDTFNKEIKLFQLGGFFIDQYRRQAGQFYEQARNIIVPRYLASFGWGLASLLTNGAVYLYVALQAVARVITLGDLSFYTQAALSLGTSFQGLLGSISDTYENNLFVNTLFEFLEYSPTIVSPPNGLQPATTGLTIEFRHVSFAYPGRGEHGPALRNVSFTIHAGEAIALVGRNGAGKTTIVKLLTRLYDPDDGQILVNGHDIREYDLDALRRQIGVIFQDYVTYYLTAGRNIGVGKVEAIDDRSGIEAAAGKSGADAVIAKLPGSYETMLGKWFDQGQQLSGGEWQKIALARAFMRNAQLLILDEPTSSLDPQAEYEVFARFRELTVGKSAVFISHRFSTVRLANRIIVLEAGSVLEEGTHDELLARGGRYAELFSLQAEAYR
jgi:ATP-binding cassette subfamily B protein